MLKLIMAKRVNVKGTSVAQKERNTATGAKRTFMGKWSPAASVGTAQYRAGRRGAQETIKQFGKTLDWLGGKDR